MLSVSACELPQEALLRSYLLDGGYADCYTTKIDRVVSLAQFVEAFYTTTVFGLERFVLRVLLSKPSTDVQVQQLALGMQDTFAAWRVEARAKNQLLLCEFTGRTRSWLMVRPSTNSEGQPETQLFFGSAVVPITDAKSGQRSMAAAFSSLVWLHKAYSKVLLSAARCRLAMARP